VTHTLQFVTHGAAYVCLIASKTILAALLFAFFQAFRNGKYRALIVSDVAARGLDVQDCDAVINLELPSEATHYAHRAGRTGRAGRYPPSPLP